MKIRTAVSILLSVYGITKHSPPCQFYPWLKCCFWSLWPLGQHSASMKTFFTVTLSSRSHMYNTLFILAVMLCYSYVITLKSVHTSILCTNVKFLLGYCKTYIFHVPLILRLCENIGRKLSKSDAIFSVLLSSANKNTRSKGAKIM